MSVITAEEFINLSTSVVEISSSTGNGKVKVLLKRVSFTTMMVDGKIPNELLKLVDGVFSGGDKTKEEKTKIATKLIANSKDEDLTEMVKLMNIVCKESMVQPRFDEIKDYMTDTQKNEIFDWAVNGVNDLKPFGNEQAIS